MLCSREQALASAHEALRREVAVDWSQSNQEDGTILAISNASLKSFGERIQINVETTGSNESILTVESKPIIKTTLFDYGVNRKNVERLAAALGGQPETELLRPSIPVESLLHSVGQTATPGNEDLLRAAQDDTVRLRNTESQ
jgi:hypothetical protein